LIGGSLLILLIAIWVLTQATGAGPVVTS